MASRLFFHSAIYKCFDDFNRTNGAVVTLQSGMKMNMAKAIILAIYCDHPAARKCCLCGSACPQCFASQPDFAKAPIGGTMLLRTPGNIEVKKKACSYIHLLIPDLLFVLMCALMCMLMCVLMCHLMYILMCALMYDLIFFVMSVLMYVLMCVLMCHLMYVLMCAFMCVLM